MSNLLYTDSEAFHYIYNDRLYTIVPYIAFIYGHLSQKIERFSSVILYFNMKKCVSATLGTFEMNVSAVLTELIADCIISISGIPISKEMVIRSSSSVKNSSLLFKKLSE